MKKFSNMKFWQKLVIVNLIPLMIISITIGILSFNKAAQSAKLAGKYSLQDAVNRMDIGITLHTRQLNNIVKALSDIVSIEEFSEENDDVYNFIDYLIQPFQEVKAITVYDKSIEVYRSKGATSLSISMLNNFTEKSEENKEQVYWSNVYNGTKKILYVYSSLKEGGIIVLEVDCEKLGESVLLKQKISSNQINFIVDKKNNIIFQDKAIPQGLMTSVINEHNKGKRMFETIVKNKKCICFSQDNGIMGWTVFSAIDEEQLFKDSDELKNYIYLVIFICVIFAFILIIITSKIITKPLARLNNAMKQLREENFNIRLKNSREDEIGEITNTFNYMAEKIENLINTVYLEQIAQKNAELAALQAQINPHFLYNSLDSINWDLIERGQMDISRVVVALGKIMQYSMDTAIKKVPLIEEYNNAKDYFLVQHNRLEDQLEYELLLDPELENVMVPKLILQPLIENAIKYGVVASNRKCKVTVQTKLVSENIIIIVHDNGSGMDNDKLLECRNSMNNTNKGDLGIGLHNVARRLQIHFDKQCEFEINSEQNKGTWIILKIPYNHVEGEHK